MRTSRKLRFTLIFFIAFFLCCCPFAVNAKEHTGYYGCSGGMMIHTGFISGQKFSINNTQNETLMTNRITGMPFGIGGVARVYITPNLRVGGEGYFSTRNYAHNGSFCRTTWGGVLADYIWKFYSFSFYMGGAIGGGSYMNLSLYSEHRDDYVAEENASYRKYSFLAVTPYIGIEIPLTDKISFNVMLDVILNVTHRSNDYATGPRLHFGIIFNHYR